MLTEQLGNRRRWQNSNLPAAYPELGFSEMSTTLAAASIPLPSNDGTVWTWGDNEYGHSATILMPTATYRAGVRSRRRGGSHRRWVSPLPCPPDERRHSPGMGLQWRRRTWRRNMDRQQGPRANKELGRDCHFLRLGLFRGPKKRRDGQWGDNSYGQLGCGTNVNSERWVIRELGSVEAISAGGNPLPCPKG